MTSANSYLTKTRPLARDLRQISAQDAFIILRRCLGKAQNSTSVASSSTTRWYSHSLRKSKRSPVRLVWKVHRKSFAMTSLCLSELALLFRPDSCHDVDLSETGSGQSASFLNLDTPDNWLAFSLSRDAVIARFPLPQPLRSPRVAENASWAN